MLTLELILPININYLSLLRFKQLLNLHIFAEDYNLSPFSQKNVIPNF